MQETKITSCILQNYCSENFPKNDRLSEMGLWPSELFRKQKKKDKLKKQFRPSNDHSTLWQKRKLFETGPHRHSRFLKKGVGYWIKREQPLQSEMWPYNKLTNLHSIAFYIETSHLFCFAKQMTGFYMKRNTGLKWVKSNLQVKSLQHQGCTWMKQRMCQDKTRLQQLLQTLVLNFSISWSMNHRLKNKNLNLEADLNVFNQLCSLKKA